MNTSSRPALAPLPEVQVNSFPYAEVNCSFPSASPVWGISSADSAVISMEEALQREQAAKAAGHREGSEQTHAALAEEVSRLRDQVGSAVHEFARGRKSYYERVETEVVQLALSIARKVLHRESQLDPLLLAGMVRVALDRIESSTRVVVRVHPCHTGEWRAHFAQCMDPRDVPEVVEDPTLDAGRCVLETALGHTELGLDVQLKEIEQGLLCEVKVKELSVERKIRLIYPTRRVLSHAARAFLEVVRGK